jgi:hypothetical protein
MKCLLEVPNDLRNIPDVLLRYVGAPEYSLALMAYIVSTYTATSGSRKDQFTANLNIQYGVVLYEPVDDEEDAANE